MRGAVQIPKIFAKDVQLLTNMHISQGDCNFAITNFCHHFGIFAIFLEFLVEQSLEYLLDAVNAVYFKPIILNTDY